VITLPPILALKDSSTCTTCPYCGVGCGVKTTTDKSGATTIEGDTSHPANFGKLCSKGYALADTLTEDNRLLSPRINGSDVSWHDATNLIATKFKETIDEYGAESVAFYVSGQLLTEDYYVVNKFVKGYLGTANVDTNSRLCMASSVAGHKRAFGSDTVPGCYSDLENANLIVLVGSNLAWCHPVLFQRIESARKRNPALKLIAIDPRQTATTDLCDTHLKINPGGESDAVLFNGLLNYLVLNNALNKQWIIEHTDNFHDAVIASADWTLENVSNFTGLSPEQLETFYAQFMQTEKVVTVYSQGVNQSHRGTDTVNSIINVHLATGRIGKKGAGPLSITGQPNAMGGREVGGLANMLTCHMDLENAEHRELVQCYWQSPKIANEPGLKAVDLFDAIDSGKIKALWVMATNPADSMPKANVVSRALTNCDFTVVSEVHEQTDTSMLATVQLPARAWSEKNGTVTNSERRISRQRAFKTAPNLARPDWRAVCEVAKAMGYESAFTYQHASEIFREYAGLSGFENAGSRDFDISLHADITLPQYDNLQPFQWPATSKRPGGTERIFTDGVFHTENKKARFIPIKANDQHATTCHPATERRKVKGDSFEPYIHCMLNTGRIRDQWHTMTRTGSSARLAAHVGEPFVEINSADAASTGIKDATIAQLSNELGSIQLRAVVTDRVEKGCVFVPMHWTNQFASNARVNSIIHAKTDPVSGQPALKNQLTTVRPYSAKTYAFLLTKEKPTECYFDYWACAPLENGWKTEIASNLSSEQLMAIIEARAEALTGISHTNRYSDQHQNDLRACWFNNRSLELAVFIQAEPLKISRQATASLLTHEFTSNTECVAALSGLGLLDVPDTGATICSCMNVGSKTIQSAIANGCDSVESIGTACQAGTQCGSCRSDLKRLLSQSALHAVRSEHMSSEDINPEDRRCLV